MPKEMSISPSFLDYLSETLDTIDEGQIANQIARHSIHAGGDSTIGSATMSAPPDGFAVDVVVHAMVKPSTVLFSCHPKAKVECTLRVPQMNFVFSSTPATADGPSGMKLTCQMSDFALRPVFKTLASHWLISNQFENQSKGQPSFRQK